ncbi:MAG: hypothetical protein GX633_09535, partial [Clostridiales bacterium]|nr:hypothetical protein [Clostridiales bacterium]
SCFIFSPAINIIMPNMSFYNLPREHQSICLSFCTALANIGAMFGTYYAILFMSAFKGFSFVMFGKTFITAQLMPGFTGIMIILFGFLVFFFNLRDKKEATEE